LNYVLRVARNAENLEGQDLRRQLMLLSISGKLSKDQNNG